MTEGGGKELDIEEKKRIASELHEKFKKTVVVIVTDYKGLDVTTMNQLRRKLRDAQVEYQVAKNSLLARASQDTQVSLIKDSFKGPSAVAFSYHDPVAPAKVLTEFAKQNEKLEIRMGVINGKAIDLSAIKALASLPAREQMLALVLCAMNAVPTALVRALNDVPRRLLNVLNAIKDQKAAA
jgi:large subunit ribosomal protein L10